MPNPWTLDAAAIATLCKTIELNRPNLVLELGSGLSTIVIASILRKNGGMLISIDHDPIYAEKTKEYLIANGLLDFVDLRLSRISACNNKSGVWYDESVFEDINDINVLIIDGPPATISGDIRMHALRVLSARMALGGYIIFDDVDRAEERRLVEAWKSAVPGSNALFLGSPKVHALLELP
jgi:predicted O-methyltransferase YrrM